MKAKWEKIADKCRFFSELSTTLYKTFSGADKVDAERCRMTAAALRLVLQGEKVSFAVAWFRNEWASFAKEQNAKAEAAPKIRCGPMSGQSVIHYKVASPCNGEQGELDILRSCHEECKL